MESLKSKTQTNMTGLRILPQYICPGTSFNYFGPAKKSSKSIMFHFPNRNHEKLYAGFTVHLILNNLYTFNEHKCHFLVSSHLVNLFLNTSTTRLIKLQSCILKAN